MTSTAPDGTIGFVDESLYADTLVTDTSQLLGDVFQVVGGRVYRILGFTIGRTEGGEAFVDWASAVGPDGKPVVTTFDPPSDPDPDRIPKCRLGQAPICGDVCTGNCVVSGEDPCDCNGFGFCFVDFYIYFCYEINCPGACVPMDLSTCGCFLGSRGDDLNGCIE